MTLTLVLASTSPRRRALLAQLGVDFEVAAPDFEEVMHTQVAADTLAAELALGKARSVAATRPHDVVIGADTFLVLDDALLGKPVDADDAEVMLARLSGRTHDVITGFAVVSSDTEHSQAVSSKVTMRIITPEEISAYVATGEPLDKAGAYALQGGAAAFIERVDGDVSAIIGLPLSPVALALRKFGVVVMGA